MITSVPKEVVWVFKIMMSRHIRLILNEGGGIILSCSLSN